MAAVAGKNWGVATLCRNRGVGDGFLFCCGTMGRFVAAVAGSIGEGVPVQKRMFAFLIRSAILPIK